MNTDAGRIKAVIFDLDGTLACTAVDLLTGINYMLNHCFGFPPLSMEEMMQGVNCCEREYVEKMVMCAIENSGRCDVVPDEKMIDECVDVYTRHYGEHYCDETYIYEGLAEVIGKMKENGLHLAVDTNKKFDQAAEIVEILIPGMFEMVVGDGMYIPKPDPEGALKIAAQFGICPEDILFVGDSDVDMRTAKNAGMTAVGVSWGYRDEETLRKTGADYIVNTPEELLALCGME